MLRAFSIAVVCQIALVPSVAFAQTSAEEEKVGKLIAQLLQDKDVNKRRLALLDLEIYPRGKGVIQALTITLEKDSEAVVRGDAALILGRWGEDAKAAIPALANALKSDKDSAVREASARALLRMVPHSRTALLQLVNALQDSNLQTRAFAAQAIKALGEQSRPHLPKLIEYLNSTKDRKDDAHARADIAAALGGLGDTIAIPTLIAVVAEIEEDVAVREAAADSIGQFGADAAGAIKPLADLLADAKNDTSLRLSAAKALAKLEADAKQIWSALKISLADPDATLRAISVRASGPCAKDEKEVVPLLAKLGRNDNDVEVRLAAVQELGRLGQVAKAAEDDLRFIAANDERELVRQFAEEALRNISGKFV